MELGGLPVRNPLEPSDEPILNQFKPSKMISQWIANKHQLISLYDKLLQEFDNRFHVTTSIVKDILIEEKNSEQDLQKFLNSVQK